MALRTLPLVFFLLLSTLIPALAEAEPGILLLAHGGDQHWNGRVAALAAEVDRTRPTEVALGMATRANIQRAVDRLVARGATEIVAVPLFVSSWSSVITSTEYLLGLRPDAPPALAMFAAMDHGAGGHGASPAADAHGAHAAHAPTASAATTHAGMDHSAHMAAGAHAAHTGHGSGSAAVVDGTTPVTLPVPVRLTPALNAHSVVAEILATRARAISQDARREALVLVAHGPNEDADNERWLADMASLARQVTQREPFASVHYLTVRDDAPRAVRDKATADLRRIVEHETAAGRRALVVPLLISFGGIERGLRERLEGLSYTMADSGLMPDARLAGWVLEMGTTPR